MYQGKTNVIAIRRDGFRRNAFFLLSGLCGLTLSYYGFLLHKTITGVVFVSKNEKHMANVRSTLSTLESQYLAKSGSLTLAEAYTIGFVDAPIPTYIKGLNKEVAALSLSLAPSTASNTNGQ